MLMTVDGTRQVVILTEKQLLGLGLTDGDLLWELPFQADRGNNATPVIDGQTVILAGLGKGLVAMKIEKQDGKFVAQETWSNPATPMAPRFSTPVLKGDLLFGYGRHLAAMNIRTRKILWEGPNALGNSAAIVDAGSVMLALGVNSHLVVYEPRDKQYKELADYQVADSETWAHPVASEALQPVWRHDAMRDAGNRIFVRDKDSVTLWTIE